MGSGHLAYGRQWAATSLQRLPSEYGLPLLQDQHHHHHPATDGSACLAGGWGSLHHLPLAMRLHPLLHRRLEGRDPPVPQLQSYFGCLQEN